MPPRRATPAPALVAAAAFALGLATSARAEASAFDLEGVGPTGIAEVGARAARADDGSAAFYDPAGLAFGRGHRVELAPQLGASALRAQGSTLPLTSPFGVTLAFASTVPLEGALADRVHVGFAGYLPPTDALRLVTHAADAPSYPYYDDRSQRLVAIPALAVRLFERLAVGVGLNVLAGVKGPAEVKTGASGAPESRLDVAARTVLAANVGVRFDPVERLHLALAYRQRFGVPLALTTAADIAGVPLRVDVTAGQALFDPDTIVAAAALDLGRASFELDTIYSAWSRYEGPWLGVHAELPGANLTSSAPTGLFRDVVSLRGAATVDVALGRRVSVDLRAGLGFEPSILTSVRQGPTNLVDGDKLLGGLGATLAVRELWGGRTLRVGVGASVQGLFATRQDKRACAATPCADDTVVGPDATRPGAGITNPGFPSLAGGGTFWSGALGVGVDL
jgi:hypothetical protein